MANRAYLLTVDDPVVTWSKDPEREVLAEGIDEIPVFWASLFVAADRRIDAYEGDDGTLEIANWCAAADVAKARLESLRAPVATLLDERSQALWAQWVDFVTQQQCGFFKTNAAEVYALNPDGYEAYWAALLAAFAKPSKKTLKAAVGLNGLEYEAGEVDWDDDEATICKLAGADHIRALPWLD